MARNKIALIGAGNIGGTLAHLVPGSALTLNDNGTLGLRILGAENTVRFAPVTLIRDTMQGVWVAGLPHQTCLLYTSPSPRDRTRSRMPSSA